MLTLERCKTFFLFFFFKGVQHENFLNGHPIYYYSHPNTLNCKVLIAEWKNRTFNFEIDSTDTMYADFGGRCKFNEY